MFFKLRNLTLDIAIKSKTLLKQALLFEEYNP